jgi:hypothetical protein
MLINCTARPPHPKHECACYIFLRSHAKERAGLYVLRPSPGCPAALALHIPWTWRNIAGNSCEPLHMRMPLPPPPSDACAVRPRAETTAPDKARGKTNTAYLNHDREAYALGGREPLLCGMHRPFGVDIVRHILNNLPRCPAHVIASAPSRHHQQRRPLARVSRP